MHRLGLELLRGLEEQMVGLTHKWLSSYNRNKNLIQIYLQNQGCSFVPAWFKCASEVSVHPKSWSHPVYHPALIKSLKSSEGNED